MVPFSLITDEGCHVNHVDNDMMMLRPSRKNIILFFLKSIDFWINV